MVECRITAIPNIALSTTESMRMNIAELLLQMMMLLRLSIVSATTVAYFVPHAGAVKVAAATEGQHMEEHRERIVRFQWEKQRRWTKVYQARRRELHMARIAKLSLISAEAILQVAATQVPTGWKATTALLGGAFGALGIYIKSQMITPEKVDQMVTSFYIAQAMKSEVYKFRTKSFPYNNNDASQVLRDTCNALSKSGSDRRYHFMQMDKKPIPTDMSTKNVYLEKRVNPRIYKNLIPRGRQFARKGRFCSNAENAFIFAGSSIGFLATQGFSGNIGAFMDKLTGWAAAFTTVSAAFANHAAKMNFESLAVQYFDKANELAEIVETWPMNCNKAGDPGWDEQIAKCEEVILSNTEEFARKRTGNNELTFAKSLL